ncbi:hypothetical protein BCR35DRAFT_310685 [Leucosporidium creatinivorum]|uniref:SnoaL-like domain-containing protein n=1 Tax=Leucosporidium creatinivorum TaxID=106004 RepID=A0A1Y2CXK3_9BASI|nr:hypothetical protein BCR35DRAFT_310685 [Leucosporidium creatinivorum]
MPTQNLAYATKYDAEAESERPVALPSAPLVTLASNVSLQPPLTHRGSGPGLVLLLPPLPTEGSLEAQQPKGWKKPLDPPPQYKWAEEGYAVLEMVVARDAVGDASGAWDLKRTLAEGVQKLQELKECEGEHIGVVVYEPTILAEVLVLLPTYPALKVLVSYFPLPLPSPVPTMLHLAVSAEETTSCPSAKVYRYTNNSPFFPLPTYPGSYDPTSASVAHSRILEFFKRPSNLAGPIFDLEELWDLHTFYEFEDRSVAKTMGTMVAEPYVNHIPTMTGGIGRKALSEFYRDHFIFSNPSDTLNTLVSRTVGIDRVVDEFVMTLTHNQPVDWLIPGIPATGKALSVPMTAVVCIRGDRLYHEHISWDQATVLKQLGLLPTHVPFPHTVPAFAAQGTKLEVSLPVLGAETAVKLLDKDAVESNGLFGKQYGVRKA